MTKILTIILDESKSMESNGKPYIVELLAQTIKSMEITAKVEKWSGKMIDIVPFTKSDGATLVITDGYPFLDDASIVEKTGDLKGFFKRSNVCALFCGFDALDVKIIKMVRAFDCEDFFGALNYLGYVD